MNNGRIGVSDKQVGSHTKPINTTDKSKKRVKGSNRGLYLPIHENTNIQFDAADSLPESQDSQGAERHYLIDGSIGVDKTRIAVRIQPDSIQIHSFLEKLLKPKKGGIPGDGIAQLPDFPEIYIKWDYGNCLLFLEFNPSDFTRDEGFELCPFELLPLVSETVIRKVLFHGDPFALPYGAKPNKDGTSYFELPHDWTRDIEVYRLDLARDFYVKDSRFSLYQLEETWPNRSRYQAATHFTNFGRLNNLSYPVADRTTKIKLYDKHQERIQKPIPGAPPIPKGTFRFEASFPRHQLRLVHITNLELLIPRRMEKLIQGKWETSNFWTNLVWEGEAIDRAHDSKLSSSRINEILGFIEGERLGIYMRYSLKDKRELKADAKKLGLKLGRSLEKQGLPYAHLHFMSGDLSGPLPSEFSHTNGALFSIISSKPLPKLS